MKILKATVILMALLLVAGTTLLVIRFQERQERYSREDKTPTPSQLQLAPNSRVTMMTPTGDGLALLVDNATSGQELVILNPRGELVRRVHLTAEQPKVP